MQTIGERIAELLKEQGKRQLDIAKLLNVTTQSVSQYCGGVSLPPVDKLVILADYFDVSTDYLLGRTNVKTTDITVKGICAYTGLSEETVKAMHKNPYTFVGKLTSDMQKHIGKLFDIQGKGEKK